MSRSPDRPRPRRRQADGRTHDRTSSDVRPEPDPEAGPIDQPVTTSGSSSGFGEPAASRFISGSPAARRPSGRSELVAPVPSGSVGPRLEAALAVGSVELEAHRSPGLAAAARAAGVDSVRLRLRGAARRSGRRAVGIERPGDPVLPEEHLLGERRPRCENSAPTDSPRWIRLIASPMSGATESVVIWGIRFAAGQRDRVGEDDLAEPGVPRSARWPGRTGRRAWRRRRSRRRPRARARGRSR